MHRALLRSWFREGGQGNSGELKGLRKPKGSDNNANAELNSKSAAATRVGQDWEFRRTREPKGGDKTIIANLTSKVQQQFYWGHDRPKLGG